MLIFKRNDNAWIKTYEKNNALNISRKTIFQVHGHILHYVTEEKIYTLVLLGRLTSCNTFYKEKKTFIQLSLIRTNTEENA